MTVYELIQELAKYDSDRPVVVQSVYGTCCEGLNFRTHEIDWVPVRVRAGKPENRVIQDFRALDPFIYLEEA